jgi:hypothetical protein
MFEDMIWKVKNKFINAYYYIKHRIKSSHNIHTGLPNGCWYDIDTMIEAGLLNLVEDYVSCEGQDAFSVISWDNHEDEIEAYCDIIEILHFKNIELPEKEQHVDKLLHDLYGGDGILNFSNGTLKFNFPEEHEEKRKELVALEQDILNRKTYFLKKIIDIRGCLWT